MGNGGQQKEAEKGRVGTQQAPRGVPPCRLISPLFSSCLSVRVLVLQHPSACTPPKYIANGDYMALNELDKKVNAKKNKSSEKETEKKKKVSLREKNAAKATVLPRGGYTIYIPDDEKQAGKSPRKPHSEQAKKKPKEVPREQQLHVVDVPSFNQVLSDITAQDPENPCYHLYKLSEVFSQCSLVKKERMFDCNNSSSVYYFSLFLLLHVIVIII